jgi:hypothetical protein
VQGGRDAVIATNNVDFGSWFAAEAVEATDAGTKEGGCVEGAGVVLGIAEGLFTSGSILALQEEIMIAEKMVTKIKVFGPILKGSL